MKYRYRVLDIHGVVPDQIRNIVGKEDAYLLYSEWLGGVYRQQFWQDGVGIAGWWSMQFAGIKS